MANHGFKQIVNDVMKRQIAQLTIEQAMVTFFSRTLYPFYKIKQKERWITRNASEGATWTDISSKWKTIKTSLKKKYPDKYPGGDKVLVFTGDLFNSVVGRTTEYHRVAFTPKKFTVTTTIPYAEHVNAIRPFTGFGDNTNDEIREKLSKFLRASLKAKARASKGGDK